MSNTTSISDDIIMTKIYYIREQKVMLDSDLAELYGVETRRLNEQVTRNMDRFPDDFMFRLNESEFESLMSQIAVRLVVTRGHVLLRRWWFGPPQGMTDIPCKPPSGAFNRKVLVLSDWAKGSMIAVRYDAES
ncbi:ORF6N domain-containing protein [Mucilaginibacter rubeus]|uniref:ORF6N domain-containing protein n=1 Tax=Mucilaginibacter rubeus TaxID=2027860 RepID=A0AAE6MHY2_9SPHI|nr:MULTISPECIES: ORF6N domain-containing protein [Mucilaginibacter]QEM03978.1 ORF6N domain-containing protein [Mucilaginibacter rubeus]QEM16587.1 ORF6N domain-containing protein [Mucilaginibacter gossypii]QTE40639.1 ORF6N domain-containing protein [Mucilaginibacter rubeus]QTE47241.1 ORF6N domain-containing protein [Mucilaginibacter rubeus]QTE58634.1 ORF6N domain-containing protein [Mucilaginibacter rubeus]